jgi:FkbM family methyltransferase
MTFISYAQNFEDVMLWRALKDVSNGFWIDVGAAHPSEYSVTRAFSERGWRGVNVEPEPGYAAALRAERPRDVNLQIAVGAASGRTRLQHLPGTGLSTFDAATADRQAKAGFLRADALEVEIRTLADICAEYAPTDIHFLKIDVEGSEAAVLEGADFARFRPWIVVVEATVPGTPLRATEGFERYLLSAGYRECWFDGLNTFYLAAEREAALAPAFRVPPNIFDGFIRADDAGAATLAAILASKSWRITAPLRAIMKMLRRS